MSASPFDHPFFSSLLGDAEMSALLGAEADLAAMARFEAALARAQAAVGMIPEEAAEAIGRLCERFAPDMDGLSAGTARDGVAVPAWVGQVRAALDEPHRAHFHVGATSQDVIDTSLVLRLKDIAGVFDARLEALVTVLARLEERFGGRMLMGRTRMQDALPIRVEARLADWRLPLERHRERHGLLLPRLLVLQLGGPVGDRAALGENGDEIARRVAEELGLGVSEKAWHSQRDSLFDFAAWLVQVSGTLGKIGQDVALMALAGGEIALAGGGGSSAMPHKANPVAAEVLVSLARYNAALLSAMGQALLHEQERSGAAWTLEWLTLPQMIRSTGSGLLLARRLLGSVEHVGVENSDDE
jgi:3-carboxy-cis,cis-muconate cycloisomerase